MNEPTPASLLSFKPTEGERTASEWLFGKADTDSLGVLVGDKAVPFFSHSGLAPALLGEVWQLSDPENSGFLTKQRFGVACRLIGHAQQSKEIKVEYLATPGPLPVFEGFPLPHTQLQSQNTGTFPSNPAPTANLITPDEKVRYARLFNNSGPTMGLLDGDKARDIFIKSKLPLETLGQIWNLADTRSRGSLDVADFTVGMHLIQGTMSGTLASLPAVLNPALYASALSLSTNSPPTASRLAPSSPLRQASGSGYGGGARTLSPQITGSSFSQQQSQFAPRRSSPFVPQTSFAPVAQQWDVTDVERAEADKYFGGLDPNNKGVVEGEMALPFMMASGLPVETLAHIWEMADIRGQGALNRDEFAVAMKLIVDKTQHGKEIPGTLPSSMIPPSLRGVQPPATQAPQHDLLSLMDDDTPLSNLASTSSPPPIMPQPTGSSFRSQSTLQPQATGGSISRSVFPQATGSSLAPTTSVFPQHTGNSTGIRSAALSPQATGSAPTASTFFDDNDAADTSSQLVAANAQRATLDAEHQKLTTATAALSTNRAELETSLAATTAALNELHEKLATARKAHEDEREMLDSLQIRKKEQTALLDRSRHELITAESDLSSLRVDRTELEGNFLRDKEEVREMQKRLSSCREEEVKLKEVLEGLKKEGRRGKGRVAIEKKMLAGKEAELEVLKKEIALEKAAPLEEDDDSPFDLPPIGVVPHATAATFPLPLSPPIVSPSGSTRSTNPFDRMSSLAAVVTSPSSLKTPTPSSPSPSTPLSASILAPVAAVAAVGVGAVAAASGALTSVFSSSPKDEDKTAETDPFGMPTTSTSKGESQSFGDDFGSSSVSPVAATKDVEPEENEDAVVTPVEESKTPVVEVAEPVKTEEVEVEEVDTPAKEEKEPVARELEETDSSDDEEGVEEATASRGHQRAAVGVEGQGTSDGSSGSFVHVPSSTTDETAIESKFPDLSLDDTPPAAVNPISPPLASPSTAPSEMDNFEDASTRSGDVFDDPTSSRDLREGAPSPPASISGIAAANKHRAAPPPPVRGSTKEASTESKDDFDDFDDLPPPAPVDASAVPVSTREPSNDFDAFDEDFSFKSDFDNPPTGSQASPQPPPFGATSTAFDDSFADFDSSFPSSTPAAATQKSTNTIESPSSFSFDDAFGGSSPTQAPLPSSLGRGIAAPPSLPSRPSVSAPPPTTKPPVATDNIAAVDQIVATGFSRADAITALEQYDWNVQRALNSLLG